MRLTLKFPLLAVACLLAAETVLTMPAIAGRTPVILPGSSTSGVGDNFGPYSDSPRTESIEAGAVRSLQSILRRSAVPSVDGQRLPISPEQVSLIQSTLLASRGSDLNPNLAQLGQQLSSELGGLGVEVSRVGNSPSAVRAAVLDANDLIAGFDSQQLATAAESPTFVSLLQLLRDANTALNSDPDVAFNEGDGEFGLLRVSPAVAQEIETISPEMELPEEEREEEIEVSPQVQPQAPAVRAPVRGLW